METRRCPQCGNEYPRTAEYWHRKKSMPDGLHSWCKACNCAKVRNDPTRDERQLRWRQEHAEHQRAYNASYYAGHRQEISQQREGYYRANADKLRAAISRYRREHPGWASACARTRKARKRGVGGSHTVAELQQQLQRQRGLCYYCGGALGDARHADHVIPISRGGSNDISNLVWACQACNQSKYNKMPVEWARGGRLL